VGWGSGPAAASSPIRPQIPAPTSSPPPPASSPPPPGDPLAQLELVRVHGGGARALTAIHLSGATPHKLPLPTSHGAPRASPPLLLVLRPPLLLVLRRGKVEVQLCRGSSSSALVCTDVVASHR
jgi:hypothetical protein